MSIGVTPLDSAGQDDRGNVPAEPTTLATAEGSVGEGPSPGVTSANDGMGGEGATPSSDGREEVFATGDGVTARAQPAIGPLPVLLRRKGEDEPVKELGPGIGEGELSTTHAIIWHSNYTSRAAVRSWVVTSVDTDQIVHILLAMADGRIKPTGDDQVNVTVRRRKGGGVTQFVDVNRVYTALINGPKWDQGAKAFFAATTGDGQEEQEAGEPAPISGECPPWLEEHAGQAKVVLFVVMYFLGGCDFLPAFHFLKLNKMFPYVVETISTPGLFTTPIVVKENGKWTVDVDQCVKMLGVCYFRMHWGIFQVAYPLGAVQMYQELEGNDKVFVERVRISIFLACGPKTKKNCPDWDAMTFQVQRAATVLRYWQEAFAEHPNPISFQKLGWVARSGNDTEELTRTNCCIKLSPHALLDHQNLVKLHTCGCKGGRKSPLCNTKKCPCFKLGKACVRGYCKCNAACVQNREDAAAQKAL
ncbi:unnamed protein product [Pylaiella littoralis]